MKKNNKSNYDKRTSNFEKKHTEKNEGEKVVIFKGSKSVQDLAKELGSFQSAVPSSYIK